MAKDGEKDFAALLTGLGFTPEARPTWTLWRFSPPTENWPQIPAKTSRSAKGSARVASPWRLAAFDLVERRHGLGVQKLVMTLDKDAFLANLAAVTRKYFGARTNSQFVYGKGGDAWCLFEFTRPGTREAGRGSGEAQGGSPLPHGLGGFNVRFMADGAHVSVIISEFFGLGFLPQAVASAPLRFVAEALGLKPFAAACAFELKGTSVHELRLPLHGPALGLLLEAGQAPEAMAELHQALLRSRGPVTPIVHADETGLLLQSPAEEAEIPPGLTEVAYTPLEVLESRERAERYRELDQQILGGKYARALKIAGERLAADRDSLYLMRRLALLGLAGKKDQPADFVGRARQLEPDTLLFLSLAVNVALDGGDQASVLACLSRLGELLMSRIEGADTMAVFDVVLPELLGDAWCQEDRHKAEECYHRIIQRRGDLPRILRKLINLARAASRPETEVAYLHRLALVERRKSELAKIHVRLAELRRVHESGRDEAIQLAQKALKLDRSHHGAALLAAELLVEKSRYEEAIQLLDSLLRDPHLHLSAKAKSRLETMIARIWCVNVRRPDLAETRYEQAVSHDGANLEALRELEALHRQTANMPGLARVLEAQFDAFEAQDDGESLKAVFDELVTLYRGALGQPRRAYELYHRVLSSGAVEPQEVDRVLGWGDVEIDWHDLYGKLSAKLSRVPAGEKRGQVLCRLAEICQGRLNDAKTALRHWREALEEGWIDSAGFQVLTEMLGQEKDLAALARAYELRLNQVSADEQRRLLVELLAVPNVLSEARRDALAVQVYLLDAGDDKTLKQRFHQYQATEDLGGIERLLQTLLGGKRLTSFQQLAWLRFVVEVLDGCLDDRRYALIDGVHRLILALAEDRIAALQEAVASLRDCPEQRRLIFYIADLLAAGILPALEERQVVKLLAGLDHELALYHQLMSFKAAQPELAAMHARTAAALYAKRAGQEANTEKMLARLCTLVPGSEDDLAQLKGLVAKTGNWILLARSLQRQADFEDERQRKYTLLEQLGVLYWKKMRDHARARLTFILAMKHAAQPSRLKLVLAQVAAEAHDVPHERKALVDFLSDPDASGDPKGMTRCVERLLKIGEEGAVLQRLVQPHIEQAVNLGDWETAGRLATVLLTNDIVSSELYRIAFKAALITRDTERAIDCWWRGLACVSNKVKAKAYMAETMLVLEKEERQDLLLNCYKAALDNRIGDRLGPKIAHELMLQYGTLLFDADTKRRKALTVYQQAYADEPEDNRTWMPLYFLLLEFGSPVERLVHLRAILPQLREDSRPLKPFPLTVESLAVELRELEDQVGSVELASAVFQGSAAASLAAPKLAALQGRDLEEDADEASEVGDAEAAAESEAVGFHGMSEESAQQLVAGESPGFSLGQPSSARGPTAFRPGGGENPFTQLAGGRSELPGLPMPAPAGRGPSLTVVGGGLPPLPAGSVLAGSVLADGAGIPELAVDLAAGPLAGLALDDAEDDQGALVMPSSGLSDAAPSASVPSAAAGTSAPGGFAAEGFSLGGFIPGEPVADTPQPAPPLAAVPDAPGAFSIEEVENSAVLDLGFAPAAEAPQPAPIDFSVEAAGGSPASFVPAGLPLDGNPGATFFVPGGLPQELAPLPLATPAAEPGPATAPAPADTPFKLDFGGGDDTPLPPLAFDLDAAAPAVPASEPAGGAVGESSLDSAVPDLGLGNFELGRVDAADVSNVELAAAMEAVPADPAAAAQAVGDGVFALNGTRGEQTGLPLPAHEEAAEAQASDSGKAPAADPAEIPEPPRFTPSTSQGSSSSGEVSVVSSGDVSYGVHVDSGDDAYDWRAAVLKGDFNADLTARLMKQAFASELEKHLAIQCVALVAGNCERLSNWHWRVWRQPDEYGYALSGKDRFPQDATPQVLHSTLLKFVIAAAPLMVRAHRSRFSLDYVAHKVEMPPSAIEKLRKAAPWNAGLLKDVGFHLYGDRIAQRRYAAYSLPGLGAEIFYDGASRSLYFDEGYYRKAPPSHLFHRILGVLWSVRIHYFVPLTLHPVKQFVPFLHELHSLFSSAGFSRLTSRLTSRSKLQKHVGSMDTKQLRSLHEKIGTPTEEQMIQLWEAMRVHVYRLLLAETLDVIGTFESILNKDLLKKDGLRHSEIYKLSPYIKGLMDFVTKLKI